MKALEYDFQLKNQTTLPPPKPLKIHTVIIIIIIISITRGV